MKSKKSKIYEEILQEYKRTHPGISNRKLNEITDAIKKNIDIDVYMSLSEYDSEHEITNKRAEYIDIMLKHYRRKIGENSKDYKSRVESERESLLKSHDIDTSAKRKHFTFKSFGKDIGFGKIKVSNKKATTKKIQNMKKIALKSPKEFVNNILSKFKPSRSKIRLTTPKGFFNKLKEKKEKNPEKFKKYRLRALIAAGIISLALGGAAINYNLTKDNGTSTTYSTEYETEHDNTQAELENELDSELETESEEVTQEIQEQEETSTQEEEQEKDETEESYSIDTLTHSLILNSNIGFNTEFKMSEGLYYETPEETGNYGSYSSFNGSNLKLTYIDAFYEDGRFVNYPADCGLSIREIIEQNPGAKISYHVETTDGKILRMEPIYFK